MKDLTVELRSARQERGVTLEEAAAATRIKIEHLRSLEAGDWPSLPPRAYVKGFLKIYAHYLELDYHSLLQLYEESQEPPEPQGVFAPPADSPPFLPGIRWQPILAGAGGVILLALLIWGGARLLLDRGRSPRSPSGFTQVDDPFGPGTWAKIPVGELK